MFAFPLRFLALCCSFFFLSSLGLSQSSAADRDVRYELRLVDGPRIGIAFRFEVENSNSTTLKLVNEWGGVINDGSDVGELKVFDQTGKPCKVEHPTATTWLVSHEPNSWLTVRYQISANKRESQIGGNDYRTHLSSEYFQMIGHLGLLTPDFQDAEAPVRFHIACSGFKKAGWEIVSSFGHGEGPFTFVGKPEDFLHSMWMAGKFEVIERKSGTNSIAVAIEGKNWGFRGSDLADIVAQIVQTERDFFDDHSDVWYLVTLSQVRNAPPQTSSIGGTALKNCFSLYCTPDLTLDKDSSERMRTLVLLAHEYFHNWNGVKIPTAGKDPETYWFSEGFTNFYARRMLNRAGLMSWDQVAEDLNSALKKYEANPNRLSPNAKISEQFWTDQSLQNLPYQRGDLVALAIDEHIRAKSQGKRSLDDLMIDLFRRPIPSPIDNTALWNRLGEWIDIEFLKRIQATVIDGNDVPLPESVVQPPLKLALEKAKIFDPCFDMEETRQAKQIRGVTDGNNAHRAGLRNGQAIQQASIFQGADPRAEITILNMGKPEVIKYEPTRESENTRVYQKK